MTTKSLKWLTPKRKAQLLQLFVDTEGKDLCVYGEANCLEPSHHYEYYIEHLISNWKLDDREQAKFDCWLERQAMHQSGEARYRAGRFGSIGSEVFHSQQPLFYLEALGISGITFTPYADVKLPSSLMHLHVDLTSGFQGVSKNRKRKALRHGKPLPDRTQAEIMRICFQAVRAYLR
ncbi:MAG: hypothetical protein Q8O55_06645 [Dehalococcoidales bacterium]|nr:hypothetical protein [Dehalococcoidales bacterium]